MRWYLNPLRIRDAARRVSEIRSGGGPRALRINGVGSPEGWLFPSSRIDLDLVARDGTTTSFAPELPLPLPLAYGYRLGRALGAPVVSDLDPASISLTIGRWPEQR